MKYDTELIDKLGTELFELWNECSIRCDKIENLLKQLNETKKNLIYFLKITVQYQKAKAS